MRTSGRGIRNQGSCVIYIPNKMDCGVQMRREYSKKNPQMTPTEGRAVEDQGRSTSGENT